MPETTLISYGHHSPRCIAQYVASKEARKAWRALWPDACIDCRGRGVAQDAAAPHEGDVPECPACLAIGTCPRCDEEDAIIGRDNPSCSNCGWTKGAPDSHEPSLAPCLATLYGCKEVAHG